MTRAATDMRIVVSGSHATGKSTLISDFTLANRGFVVLPDPFDLVDAADPAGVASFQAQLRIAAERLEDPELGSDVIAERGPLDFVAYLRALDALGRSARAGAVAEAEAHRAAAAIRRTDLWVVLPVVPQILVDTDEDPDLRDAMDEALLDLLREEELHGGIPTIELSGSSSARVSELESAVRTLRGSP